MIIRGCPGGKINMAAVSAERSMALDEVKWNVNVIFNGAFAGQRPARGAPYS